MSFVSAASVNTESGTAPPSGLATEKSSRVGDHQILSKDVDSRDKDKRRKRSNTAPANDGGLEIFVDVSNVIWRDADKENNNADWANDALVI